MSAVAVIGERERLRGFALAGVRVLAAEDPAAVRIAWDTMAADVGLVLLTPAAHAALEPEHLGGAGARLWAVMPA